MTDEITETPEAGEVQETVEPQGEVAGQPSEWSEDDEREARIFGWKPAAEWRGSTPPKGLIEDPREYMEYANSLSPFRRAREGMEKAQREVTETKRQMEERFRKLEGVMEATIGRERERAKAEIARLTAEQRAAVETGDTARWEALERQKFETAKAASHEEPKPNGMDRGTAAAIEKWAVQRDWFRTDGIKTAAAVAAYDEAIKAGYTTPEACLDYVDKVISQRFPEKSEVQKVRQTVSAGMALGGGSRASAFSKLPPEAQQAFRDGIKKGYFEDTDKDRDFFAEEYSNA